MKQKIIEISKELNLSHISSNLSCLPILEEIYAKKKPEDKVGLSGAHAHLAHLVVSLSQAKGILPANNVNLGWIKDSIKDFGIHCDRKAGCDISGGSLGHSGIALGMALANPDITIYWIETDGSLNEGSAWEMLRLKKLLRVDNLKVYVNMNGSTALEEIDRDELSERLRVFCPDINIRYTDNVLPELFGVKGHYAKL